MAISKRPSDPDPGGPTVPADHGAHSLRTLAATVVGLDRDDVFVDMGPRLQGVLSLRCLSAPPSLGQVLQVTLRGQEQGLWRVAPASDQPLIAWERMRCGQRVEARVVGVNPGGFELKVGPVHAFMPRSHSGLERRGSPRRLLGRSFAVEILEVDRERQRILVSRKLAMRRERDSRRARGLRELRPGAVVEGRVVRIESFGAFVRFGAEHEGLLHVSNLSHDPVGHPSQVVRLGENLRLVVLTVRADGKRIGLGLKQLGPNPWTALAKAAEPSGLVEVCVLEVLPDGLVVASESGARGFVPHRETGVGRLGNLRQRFGIGARLAARLLSVDSDREWARLSLLHTSGAQITQEELEGEDALASLEHLEECIERDGSGHLPAAKEAALGASPAAPPVSRAVRVARALLQELRDHGGMPPSSRAG